MKLNYSLLRLIVTLSCLFINANCLSAEDDTDLFSLSLTELLNLKVSTVSRWEETLDASPASIEIITQDDIQRRGYKDLSYILDDIAGVQVTRTYGDNYFNTLWRGVRHTIGSSHLVLIDGIKFNHLYNNEAEILASFPLSNIHHVEIVYGPASVAYGNDAVVGIINIITVKETGQSSGFVQIGENNSKVIDFTHLDEWQDFNYRVSGRYDKGDLDMSNATNYLWTDPELLSNTAIWGELSRSYGAAKSSHLNKAMEFSLFDDATEVTIQYLQLATNYGLAYTFDHSLPKAGLWYETEYSAHWKQKFTVREDIEINTLLRYRGSNIDNDSLFIEGYLVSDPLTGNPLRLVDASYWESKNDSFTGSAELNWQINPSWTLLGGVEVESKSLQKAYNINFGPSIAPADLDLSSYPFPSPPQSDTVPNNRKSTSQKGLFLLSQYHLDATEDGPKQTLHFGLRVDSHSIFGTKSSIRTGYVSQWDKTTLKLFYGEAYQEPSARLLYGGWQGSGSDPNLQPRNAKTLELNVNYKLDDVLLSANIYRMESDNLFNTTDDGAVNAGLAVSDGGDIKVQYQPKTESISRLSLWFSYSWQNSKEQDFNQFDELDWNRVGDIADETLHGGAYITFNDAWQFNLRGRYYGARPTVLTNSVDEIKSFASFDANIIYQVPSIQNLKVSLDITNLFDNDYFHPGVRSASATSTVGNVDNNGVWIGSGSFYNAKIPQPGREIRLSLYWNY